MLLIVPASSGIAMTDSHERVGPWEPAQVLVAHQRVERNPLPAVEVTPRGRAVVLWSVTARKVTLPNEVYAVEREPGAAAWSAPVLLNGSESTFNTAVVSDGAGRVTAAWQAFGPGGAVGIWTRTSGPAGGWQKSVRVATYQVKGGATVDLSIDAAGHAMVVAWRSRGGLFARVRTPAGEWTQLQNLPSSARAGTVAASVDEEGRADVVAFQTRGARELLVDWRQTSSGDWRRTVVGTMGGDQTPSVASNRRGDLVVTWTRQALSGELQSMMRTRPAGGVWGEPVVTGTRSAAVDVDVTGHRVTVVRQRFAHGHVGVLEQRRLDGALVWRHRLGRTSQYDPVISTLDANAGQVLVFYYTSHRDETGGIVRHGWTLRCTDAGACGDPSKDKIPPVQYPQAALGADGTATFAWSAGCRTEECLPTRVVSRRLLPAG